MIEVVEPGALTSVQTAGGRLGWRHLGVPVGGAVDPWSARLANRLVDNPDDAPLLEATLDGPALRFVVPMTVAMAGGDFAATLDGLPMPLGVGRHARAGSLLRLRGGRSARCYVAIGGGIDVELMLGSSSTDLRTGFGGHHGRALRGGDRLAVGVSSNRLRRWKGTPPSGPIRIVPGPHAGQVGMSRLASERWTVGSEADRTGVRLDGPSMASRMTEVPSMALPLGAIQVPPDGRPIVMLADCPVTGGYPVPACVIRADIGRVAQLRAGDGVTFAPVSIPEALDALHQREAALAALDDVQVPPDDELGWIGALE